MRQEYEVRLVTREECAPFVLEVHYARRWPSITYAYGLFHEEELVGVVTYGTPPSAPLRRGLAGDAHSLNVLELNRLCLKHNKKNEASMLVGKSLKLLPQGKLIISFADTDQGHVGFVYQACNFKYYGLSAKRTDWKVKGLEHLHGQTIADKFKGKGRADALRELYGEAFYLKDRPRKHRYVYATGDKKTRQLLYDCVLYKEEKYPKGERDEHRT